MNSTATTGKTSKDDHILAAIERQLPDPRAIYRFSNAGTRYERLDSDIDVAVLTEQAHDPVTILDLAQDLGTIFGRDVGLVDLRRTLPPWPPRSSTRTSAFCAWMVPKPARSKPIHWPITRVSTMRANR